MLNILTIHDSTQLDDLSDLLQDCVLDIDNLLVDASTSESRSIISVPFKKEFAEERDQKSRSFLKVKVPVFQCFMKIYEVERYEIEDSEGIGFYDIEHVDFDRTSMCLTFVSSVPLVFQTYVAAIRIDILREPTPSSYVTRKIVWPFS